jgi:N-acyl-D-amino-acid deacylase
MSEPDSTTVDAVNVDIVIRGGLVVDGTGAPGVLADVAVSDGRIVAIGADLVERGYAARDVLDAHGQVVAPGFIDIHTHYDAQVFFDPALTPSSFHGVTTVVAGNCGFSLAPVRPGSQEIVARTLENVEDMDFDVLIAGVPWDFETFRQYLESVERRGSVLNYAAYLGHTALRLFVMGDDAAYERPATDEEVAAMQDELRDALRAGAAGLATSFAIPHRGANGLPVPSRFSEPSEFEALLEVMAQERRGVVAVAPGDQCGIDRLYELQPAVGLPFTYGALLTNPAGTHERLVELNRRGWEQGIEVWPQVTPRTLNFQFTMDAPYLLNASPEFAALGAGTFEQRRDAYADPAWRARAWSSYDAVVGMKPRWDTYEFGDNELQPHLEGQSVAKLAAEQGVTPLDVLLAAALQHDDLQLRVKCIVANDNATAVAGLLLEEHCTLGLSDAGAHVSQLCDAPQATDFLGNWVRDRQLMAIETAVRKLTGVQADLFGFTDRGYLREGAWADIAVFDPATVAPGPLRRVRDFPGGSERLTADAPVGMTHVLVNGTIIRRDGESTEAGITGRPGQLLRPAVRA